MKKTIWHTVPLKYMLDQMEAYLRSNPQARKAFLEAMHEAFIEAYRHSVLYQRELDEEREDARGRVL